MKVGPKYKIARRLGAGVFEKTQGPKFALAAEKKNFSTWGTRSRSRYGSQLLEKQKVRFTYGITSKQLTNYVKSVIATKTKTPEAALFDLLERRLDNIALKSGLASTRFQARQMVSHGHLRVNDKKMKVPSFQVREGDVVTVKESSREKALFLEYPERFKETAVPAWLKITPKDYSIKIEGSPHFKPTEAPFNMGDVLQFFKR
jgi:small subunit ribosomal protein S4